MSAVSSCSTGMISVGSSATRLEKSDKLSQRELSAVVAEVLKIAGVQCAIVGQSVQTMILAKKSQPLPEIFCFNFKNPQGLCGELMELLHKYQSEQGSLHERIYAALTEKINEEVCNKFVQQLADQPVIRKEELAVMCRQLLLSVVSYSKQEPVDLESCVKALMEMLRPGLGFVSQNLSHVTPADMLLSCADTHLQWHFPAQEYVLELIQKEQADQSSALQYWASDSLLTQVFYLSDGMPSPLLKSLLSQLAQKIDGLSHHQLQKLLDSVVLAATGNEKQAYQVKLALMSFFVKQRCLFVFDGRTSLGRCVVYEESVV